MCLKYLLSLQSNHRVIGNQKTIIEERKDHQIVCDGDEICGIQQNKHHAVYQTNQQAIQ